MNKRADAKQLRRNLSNVPATQQLRYAPLVRVSTEAQAVKGESLRTQRSQIQRLVKSMGGTIPEGCLSRYDGQEHATPDQERRFLDTLLEDASKGMFDAVIVCDASRWSRDNANSKKGLEILRANGIRFFVGSTEYDLDRPEHRLFLGMATEINEFYAAEQNRKSRLNRIARAERNIATAGKLPYGRTFDVNKITKEGGWGINEEQADKIRWAADSYLNGDGLGKIAQTLGMNPSNLWKILTRRSGDTWAIRFHKTKHFKDEETIELKIPPLLPKQTIDKILSRAAANKTYTHGHLKTVIC
jgi:site-specific DNA recombinase